MNNFISPALSMLTISTEKVEKVVKDPKNPMAMNAYKFSLSIIPIKKPNNKEPMRLTASVPTGNGVLMIFENNKETAYLQTAPKKPPAATKITDTSPAPLSFVSKPNTSLNKLQLFRQLNK